MSDRNNKGTQTQQGRGFAGMDPEKQREIASEGGRASHASGHGHEFTSKEAQEAGRKGGEASHSGHTAQSNQGGGRTEQRSGQGSPGSQSSQGGQGSQSNQSARSNQGAGQVSERGGQSASQTEARSSR